MKFKKDDPVLCCMVMALAMSPMPHYWKDEKDYVELLIVPGVSCDRIYELGAMSIALMPAIQSLMKHYRKGGKFYLRTPKKI